MKSQTKPQTSTLHPYTLTKDKTGLLIIDAQEKFRPVMPDFTQVEANIVRLVLTFQMFNMPILVSEQYPQGLGNTVENIRVLFPFLEVVEKMEFACTENKQFQQKLASSGLTTLVVVGLESHVCVNQTVLGLLHQGLVVHIVTDAITTRHTWDHDAAIRKMERAGALPATTEMVMFELAQQAGTSSFKNIQKMIKGTLRKEPRSVAETVPVEVPSDIQPETPAGDQLVPPQADESASSMPSTPDTMPDIAGADSSDPATSATALPATQPEAAESTPEIDSASLEQSIEDDLAAAMEQAGKEDTAIDDDAFKKLVDGDGTDTIKT